MSAAAPCIVGVRHHSPGCARLVAARIRALRPRHVLIEGPADFNERLDELFLGHTLPLAIYSYLSGAGVQRGSWSPFAEHSPEWQALNVAREVGAQIRFIDLPAWHEAMFDLPNRYADAPEAVHEARAEAYEQALADALAIEGRDALWDHLFEQDEAVDVRARQLDTYFEHLRGEDPGSDGNRAREAYMAQWIAWAMSQGDGAALVVCGGYHAPALARLWREAPALLPEIPLPPVADDGAAPLRHGSFLVPYSYQRLDAFQGYASGMSSPLYYQWLWQHGSAGAGEVLLREIAQRLRQRKLVVSTADLIAVHTHARALADLRGHAQPLRADWLDAIAAALLKDAQIAPLPWSYRGRIRPGTAPLLVEAMDVLAGDERGRLAPTTPQPPLLASVVQALAAAGLELDGSVELDLLRLPDRVKSRVLHKLLLLQIPGVERREGPALALSGERQERWQLGQPLEQQAALIEAGAYGATLDDAARAMLEERLREAGSDALALAQALNAAAFAGLADVGVRLLRELQDAVAAAAQLEPLGEALGVLHPLYRHGGWLGMAGAPLLGRVIEAAFDRALWLLEPPAAIAPADAFAHVRAVTALRDIVRAHWADLADARTPLALEPERALAVFLRKARSGEAAAISRGAALGALVSLPQAADCIDAQAFDLGAALALLQALPAEALGDALSGLLALAREQLAQEQDFVAGLDALVRGFDDEDFLRALPALRGAFTWLPPRERGVLAAAVLRLHGAGHLSHRALTASLPAQQDALQLAQWQLQERQQWQLLQEWGVLAAVAVP